MDVRLYISNAVVVCFSQFVENMTFVMRLLDKESDLLGGVLFGGGDRSESLQMLRNFLGSFVDNLFMATLCVDFK